MNIGRLNKRVAIQTQANVADGLGGVTVGWTTLATVWASVSPLSMARNFIQGQFQATITHELTIRFLSGVAAGSRVVYGDRTFRVISVIDPGERHAQLRLLCDELGAGAS